MERLQHEEKVRVLQIEKLEDELRKQKLGACPYSDDDDSEDSDEEDSDEEESDGGGGRAGIGGPGPGGGILVTNRSRACRARPAL